MRKERKLERFVGVEMRAHIMIEDFRHQICRILWTNYKLGSWRSFITLSKTCKLINSWISQTFLTFKIWQSDKNIPSSSFPNTLPLKKLSVTKKRRKGTNLLRSRMCIIYVGPSCSLFNLMLIFHSADKRLTKLSVLAL